MGLIKQLHLSITLGKVVQFDANAEQANGNLPAFPGFFAKSLKILQNRSGISAFHGGLFEVVKFHFQETIVNTVIVIQGSGSFQ